MNSRKILFITYYWPPSGGVGVQRWMNFSLQLKQKGWEPIILTPENPQFEVKDSSLIEKVKDIPVYKLPIWEPFNLFHQLTGGKNRKNIQQGLVLEKSSKTLIDRMVVWIRGNVFLPDPRVFWVRKAAQFALQLIKKEEIPFLITTGPPHSMHLIGRKIKRSTNIHWVADFRDPWSKWDVLDKLKTMSLARTFHRKMEGSVLNEANKVITVSPRLAKSLGEGVEVVFNGITNKEPKAVPVEEDTFVIGYFGMLNELRNPTNLWLLLDQLCRENEGFANKLQIKIGGIVSESIKEELAKLQILKGKVQFLGYLSHKEVIQEYKRCNLLLLLLNKTDNSNWILPVKFFEYLTANRMILGLGVRSSDLGDLMNNRNVGQLLSYTEINEIRTFILEVFEKGLQPSKKDVSELLHQFSHEHLVERLEEILIELDEQH